MIIPIKNLRGFRIDSLEAPLRYTRVKPPSNEMILILIREPITGKHANTAIVKQELRQHIESITLLPEGDAIRYKGKLKLLGEWECAEGAACSLSRIGISEAGVLFEGLFKRAA